MPDPPPRDPAADLALVGRTLRALEKPAARLPWATDRAWAVQTHVWIERDVPVVDLHDLSVKLGTRAVREVARVAPRLSAASVVFVTGHGKRRPGGESNLRTSVEDLLAELERKHGWRFHPRGDGRFVVVLDAARAPPSASTRLGTTFWVATWAFLAAASLALWPIGPPIFLVAVCVWWFGFYKNPHAWDD